MVLENHGQNDVGFFVPSDSEDEDDGHIFKRRKIDFDSIKPGAESGSDEEWEDVSIPTPVENTDNAITIAIKSEQERKRHLQFIKEKQSRISLHYLSMVMYTLFAYKRNNDLLDARVLKRLKKLIPRKLMKQIKNLHETEDPDKTLIYILKYLIKWFRLNFKCESNGLRILGYLPKNAIENDYFPDTASPVEDLASIVKKFAHNRDTGAQIFTAILRSLGWDSRLVFSLPLLPTRDASLQPKLDKNKLKVNKDNDLLYPYFWTELVNPLDSSEIIILETMCFHNEDDRLIRLNRTGDVSKSNLKLYFSNLFCPKLSQFNKMTMHSVIALTSEKQIIDVSPRYMGDIAYRYFNKLDLRTEYGRTALLFKSILKVFHNEIINEETKTLRNIALINFQIPTTFAAMKRNPNVVTMSTLRYNENIIGSTPLAYIKIDLKKEPVYFKHEVLLGKSERQWMFLGRSINPSELLHPVKTISAMTPRTTHNRRIYELNQMNNPELNNVNLYSYNQTIPFVKMRASLIDGKLTLPRNKYGNIEIFHPCMIPDNCEWVTLSNIVSILKEYSQNNRSFSIEYVPVVVGFNFTQKYGHAIPVVKGVIVFEADLIDIKRIWFQGKIKMHKLELASRKYKSLTAWRTFLRLLRIKQNLNLEYGSI